jgi:hypothetical protein
VQWLLVRDWAWQVTGIAPSPVAVDYYNVLYCVLLPGNFAAINASSVALLWEMELTSQFAHVYGVTVGYVTNMLSVCMVYVSVNDAIFAIDVNLKAVVWKFKAAGPLTGFQSLTWGYTADLYVTSCPEDLAGTCTLSCLNYTSGATIWSNNIGLWRTVWQSLGSACVRY